MNKQPDHVLGSVLSAIGEHDHFVILGHEDPDADCLGSQRVMASWLQRRKKKVYLCSPGPWRRPEIRDWEPLFSNVIPSTPQPTLFIILDCSSMERTGFPNSLPKNCKSCVIDHHASGTNFGNIRYIDPSSPSTTLMVQNLIEYSGDTLTREDAEILFLGFCTDTGYFRHLESDGYRALESVSRLLKAGASPTNTFGVLSGGRSLSSRRLLGRVLESCKTYLNDKVVLVYETIKDSNELGNQRDSDMLYQIITSISGIELAIIVREQSRNKCIVGLRSLNDIDVGEIAREFGGGGHRKAAGCNIHQPLKQVIEHLLEIAEKKTR